MQIGTAEYSLVLTRTVAGGDEEGGFVACNYSRAGVTVDKDYILLSPAMHLKTSYLAVETAYKYWACMLRGAASQGVWVTLSRQPRQKTRRKHTCIVRSFSVFMRMHVRPFFAHLRACM